jgi:hypothetical protein
MLRKRIVLRKKSYLKKYYDFECSVQMDPYGANTPPPTLLKPLARGMRVTNTVFVIYFV